MWSFMKQGTYWSMIKLRIFALAILFGGILLFMVYDFESQPILVWLAAIVFAFCVMLAFCFTFKLRHNGVFIYYGSLYSWIIISSIPSWIWFVSGEHKWYGFFSCLFMAAQGIWLLGFMAMIKRRLGRLGDHHQQDEGY